MSLTFKILIPAFAFVTSFLFSLIWIGGYFAVSSQILSQPLRNGPFPNELRGYEFFGKGRLKNVGFGTSTKQDIEKLFGGSCESGCEYDERFLIKFDYLSCDDCMTTEYIRDRAMCPLNKYMDTIEKITLTPRTPVDLVKVPASTFQKHYGGQIFPKDGSGQVSYLSFEDDFGLKYSIRQGSGPVRVTNPAPYIHGPLYSIEYGLSRALETRIFKAKYTSCTNKP